MQVWFSQVLMEKTFKFLNKDFLVSKNYDSTHFFNILKIGYSSPKGSSCLAFGDDLLE
jgi:hypothetical protein